ncbi:alpha/beta hydrolase [Isoptericola halotolerans]|uniref:alpha/beta hydrolase n=1 Tax=Isoptericola halotolerans TaxID=300560 RepID=UPI00388FD338
MFPARRTVHLGESLGATVATALAAELPSAALLLRSPFTSLADTAAPHYPLLPVDALLRDRHDVVTPLAGVLVPVTVVHGTADTIVPPEQSTTVARTAPHLVEHLVLPGAGHYDPVMFGPEIADAVVRLAARAGL